MRIYVTGNEFEDFIRFLFLHIIEEGLQENRC